MRIIRSIATVGATVLVAVVAASSPAAANVATFTVYPSDQGESSGVVTSGTEAVETMYALSGAPAADPGGGSDICTAFVTRPHATPASPRDGRIYVEGEAHMECGGTPSEMWVNTFIGWIVTRDDGVTTGYHLQPGGSTYCAKRRRCPSTGELIAPWGYETRCYTTGTYTAHVVVNYRYKYRGGTFSFQVEGPDITGSYGRGC